MAVPGAAGSALTVAGEGTSYPVVVGAVGVWRLLLGGA